MAQTTARTFHVWRGARRPLLVAGDERGHSIPCMYCRAAIAPRSFAYLSPRRQLVCASCPGCKEDVMILAATWRRLSGLLGEP